MTEVIAIRQLPVIEERLRQLSAEVDGRVESAMALVCTEETVKEIKRVRADLNKELSAIDTQRKAVKAAILAPYEAFEAVYRECVGDKFKAADLALKGKIDEVEGELKARKRDEVAAYFDEYAASLHINFVAFERSGINVTLSASLKSLKEQAKAFLDGVAADIILIDTQPYRDEIMAEYKRTLSAAKTIAAVIERHEAAAREAQAREERAKATAQLEEVAAKTEAFMPPRVVEVVEAAPERAEGPELTITFTATAARDKLLKLREFMKSEGIQYE